RAIIAALLPLSVLLVGGFFWENVTTFALSPNFVSYPICFGVFALALARAMVQAGLKPLSYFFASLLFGTLLAEACSRWLYPELWTTVLELPILTILSCVACLIPPPRQKPLGVA